MAGLSGEWGKVVCISIGQLKFDETGMPIGFSSKSYYGDDEKELLSSFMKIAAGIMQKKSSVKWAGHYIKGFDIPFIIKRCVVNQVPVIRQFHLHKLKPWETCLIDTKEVWSFGSWGNSARLGHLAEILDIPTPKDEIKGAEVNAAYWGGRLEEIKDYCEKDIKATANLLLRLSGIPIIEDSPLPPPF
jgi:predicted PolB exonuclease-like 3'-5' exonuclease